MTKCRYCGKEFMEGQPYVEVRFNIFGVKQKGAIQIVCNDCYVGE